MWTDGIDIAPGAPPRFEHGEELLVVVDGDGPSEFRSDSPGEYIKTDTAIAVAERR